jgi:hypothetical protein
MEVDTGIDILATNFSVGTPPSTRLCVSPESHPSPFIATLALQSDRQVAQPQASAFAFAAIRHDHVLGC